MARLIRGLSFVDALSLVVGSMIGTGVFLKSAKMAEVAGTPTLVLAAWGIAGILSLIGALTYAQVGKRYPEAGGEYVYLREGYGSFVGFLYGWSRFWIASPGSVAAYGVGAATFLGGAASLKLAGGRVPVAVAFILIFTLLNCLTVAFGGRLQAFLTFVKVACILVMTFGVFFLSGGSSANFVSSGVHPGFGMSHFGAAVLAALWAFDGWNNLPMAAGEIKNPEKNLPRALILGSILVLVIYSVVNLAYFYALPFSEVVTANSSLHPDAPPVATRAVMTFWGSKGGVVLSLLFVISALGAMNGSILTGARVPYAMAKDGLFFPSFRRLHSKTAVPFVCVLCQGVISCALALSGTFDQLTDYVVFASWIFYGLVAFSVVRLESSVKRRFLPGLFTVAAIFLLGNTLYTSPKESFLGLVFILIGIPAYFLFKNARIAKEPEWQKA